MAIDQAIYHEDAPIGPNNDALVQECGDNALTLVPCKQNLASYGTLVETLCNLEVSG